MAAADDDRPQSLVMLGAAAEAEQARGRQAGSPAPEASRLQRAAAAMSMNAEELRVVRAYCERVGGSELPAPGQFGTREAFQALGSAFSYWCAESLVCDQAIPHRELITRSALFNMSLAHEMKQRYALVEAANEEHLRQIAALRAKLEHIHDGLLASPARKRNSSAVVTPTRQT